VSMLNVMLHANAVFSLISMLHVHAACHASQCSCISTLHVHASYPCCMFMLHIIYMLHFHDDVLAAFSCCIP
jgi:hypothetical protein